MSVCLTAKADDTKLIVFQGAKLDSRALNEEFQSRCVVTSSSNGWMSEELVLEFLRQDLGMFSLKKHLFAWDNFEAHITEDVRNC